MFIDTHTHIYLEQFDSDRAEVMRRAKENNIGLLLLPNIDEKSIQRLKSMVEQYPEQCRPMMGLHPCSINENFQEDLSVIENELFTGEYIAVGEIGIDLYWDSTNFDQQVEAYKIQLEWAKELNLPVSIHSRDSLEHTIDFVSKAQNGYLNGVFHCFTGSIVHAERIIDLNFKLGIGGVLTFKNSGLDKIVKEVGLEHFVLETDSPYLSPAPMRGKRNESSYLIYIAEKLAEIHTVTLKELEDLTTKGAKNLFKQSFESLE